MIKARTAPALAGCMLAGLFAGCGDKGKDNETGNGKGATALVITAIPDEKVSDQEVRFQALQTYLAGQLGIRVEFSISKDYAAAVQRFANGEVHMAWFGGLTGVQARDRVEGARAIAQGAADPQFKSYFIANTSTGLERSDEFPTEAIRDLTFTFGSPSSTSGRLMPEYFVRKNTGKSAAEFFSRKVQFQKSGGHVATAEAVQAGSVQVGALNFKTYDSMVADGRLDPGKAPIIWVTPDYADYNLTVHGDLDNYFGDGFIDKLQKALVECSDQEVLKAFNREALIPASNDDFAGIEAVAKELGLMR
ncbi:MAG: putative selenate ABC transporter substrate-binding protein [Roseibacillus sp.]|nr:putative selenate ABC transporter substrate-binding protein [Roseibacillus sp.]MDP7308796.1 putative selenate ABC transporter substrate-binding protein [Roseibacillus sp.]HJM63484.1 putative selenate ABC transporter substrate-binding protein [Roseibacillus sp.]